MKKSFTTIAPEDGKVAIKLYQLGRIFSLFEEHKFAMVIDEKESDRSMVYRFIYRVAQADE